MGCFSSKSAQSDIINDTAPSNKTSAATPTYQPQHKQMTASTLVADPTAQGADPSGQVLSVPRSAVTIGDREKAELKLKNMRDKMEDTIKRSESLLKSEGKLALQFKREGKAASTRVLLRKRVGLKDRIRKAELTLDKLSEMIDNLEIAHDNRRLIDALDKGNKVISDIQKDMSVDRVQSVLNDHHAAIEYVQQINDTISQNAGPELNQQEYDELINILEQEQEVEPNNNTQLPQVPTVFPDHQKQNIDQVVSTPIAIAE